jgi:hypothetical protein
MYIPINNVDLQNGVETFESPFSFLMKPGLLQRQI